MKIEFTKRSSHSSNAINDFFTITIKNGEKYSLRQSVIVEAPNSDEFVYSKTTDYSKVPLVLHKEYNLVNTKSNNNYHGTGLVVLPIIHGDKVVNDDETFNTYIHMTSDELKKPKYQYGLIKEDFFDKLN
nr:hypothetical protein [Lactiplantibacillus plantarum]